jgi:hypothetical protein
MLIGPKEMGESRDMAAEPLAAKPLAGKIALG